MTINLDDCSPTEIWDAIESDPMLLEAYNSQEDDAYYNFRPREDQADKFDQQKGFFDSRDSVAFLVGGNAAGTTEVAMAKIADFVLRRQPPPRKDTPFWIISNTYEQVCDVCWAEKLEGHGHIPDCEINRAGIEWMKSKQNRPFSVPLKPWPKERGGSPRKNWRLEFKSFEQGRTAMQAKSIGGFCFSEQFPLDLFLETLRGCREYMYPGSMFAEFTPIDPELCLWVEKIIDEMPPGWEVYRCNTELNRPNLADGWFENFFAAVPDEMLATRMTGELASFEGVIYQGFNKLIHVVKGDPSQYMHKGMFHYRGVDWGFTEEHPFCCVWGCKDSMGQWFIYDEYWSNDQSKITLDHGHEILKRSQTKWNWPGKWVDEKWETGSMRVWKPQQDKRYGTTWAGSDRPGEINLFNRLGIYTSGATHDVWKGIDHVRSLLVPRAEIGPLVRIHESCQHLIYEMRKYRAKKGSIGRSVINPQVTAKPMPLKHEDDMVDAGRYMLYKTDTGAGSSPSSMSHDQYAKKRRAVQLDKIQKATNGTRRVNRSAGIFTGRE